MCIRDSLDVKPVMVCRTKSDIECDLSEQWNRFEKGVSDISAVSGEGLNELISKLSKAVG